uniref:Proton pump-interactor 2 n=1 Tax=Noccaea caerulescens TaxID=107243 RepID=A0A1J3DHL7_NOCCA
MGAQIILYDGFEVVPPPEMNDLILFGSDQSGGSNCDESTVTTEEDGTVFSGDSSPGRPAEEEWPEGATTPFSFYIVKQPAYDDPEIKAKIDEADSEIYQFNKLRIDVSTAQKSERAEISSLLAQTESLVTKFEGCKVVFEEKTKEFDTLHESLRNLRCSSSDQLCLSKEELDHLIYIAHYVIEHGSTGLEEEDWVLKETEKPDDGLIRLSEDSLAKKEASIQSLKSMAVELNEARKEFDAIAWNINLLSDKMGKIQNKIKVLDVEMARILDKRDRSYERIKMLRIRRDRGNAAFFQSLAVMRKAKELAASGNVRDLEVFASSEVDRFMTQWNHDKAFRDDYVKRTSQSLLERQLSRDGRIKDPEAKVVGEKQAQVKTREDGVAFQRKNRDDSSSNSSQNGDDAFTGGGNRKKKAVDLNRSSAEESDVIDLVYESPKKEEEEVDEETLKERKREEQVEKARLAMERKRKLQEKADAKAAIRAQKEAEKKLKECEKKAKKKAAANSPSPSESDQSRGAIIDLKKVRTLAVSGKERHQKEERLLFPKQRSFRYKHRGRGTEALPKAILNRRKAHRYWVWGLSSAALALALVLVFLLLR